MSNQEIVQKTSNAKVAEALEILNEAAKEKGSDFKDLITDRYEHIKKALTDETVQGKEIIAHAQRIAKEAIIKGKEKAKETALKVDKHVHENPWAYIGGVAAVSIFLGYLLGSKRK